MSKPVNYFLTSTQVKTFCGYKRPGKALKEAGKWIDEMNKEYAPWGVTVLGIHTYADEDGTFDATVTLEVS